MKRREMVAAGAALATLTPALPSAAQGQLQWKMVTSWPRNTPGVGVNAQRLADLITTLSQGQLTVQLYAAGELVPPLEVIDAVQQGTAEMGHTALYYGVGKQPALHFFTNIPFGLDATELMAWLRFGDGQRLKDQALAPLGVRAFFVGSSNTQAMGWFRRQIHRISDLQGLKMRIAGLGGAAMVKLGVTPVLLPPGEIFGALQSGTVDAAEWVGPWNDLAFGLHKVASHYYLPAFHEPGPALDAVVNRRAFDALPASLQAVVECACRAVALETMSDFLHHNVQAFAALEEHGVEVHALPIDVIQALREATRTVVEELMGSNIMARRVGDSYLAYASRCDRYSQAMTVPMLQQRANLWQRG